MRRFTTALALLAVFALPLASADVAATEPAALPWQQVTGASDLCAPAPEQSQAGECVDVAQNCLRPIKPIPSIKPIWCTGSWTQILECDRNCNCQWREVCIN